MDDGFGSGDLAGLLAGVAVIPDEDGTPGIGVGDGVALWPTRRYSVPA